jgi:hypothetical protein
MPVLRRLAEATGETAHLSHLVAGRCKPSPSPMPRARASG